MTRVRFLQSAIIPGQFNSFGYNDEAEVSPKLAEALKKQGVVDVLAEDKNDTKEEAPAVEDKPKRNTRANKSKEKAEE